MNRINVTDADGGFAGWFDQDRAEVFREDRETAGKDAASADLEALYRTSGGRWVLERYSNYQGSRSRFTFLTEGTARQWLLTNSHDDAVEHFFGELAEEEGPRTPGRPPEGERVTVRIPQQLITALDARAQEAGTSRAEELRQALTAALT